MIKGRSDVYVKKTIRALVFKFPKVKIKYAVSKKNLKKFMYDKRKFLYLLPIKYYVESAKKHKKDMDKRRII